MWNEINSPYAAWILISARVALVAALGGVAHLSLARSKRREKQGGGSSDARPAGKST